MTRLALFDSPLANPAIIPNPFPIYDEIREKDPVHWNDGLGAWALTSYDDCNSALQNKDLIAGRMSEVLDLKFPKHGLSQNSIYYRFSNNVMMYTDAGLHNRLRRSTRPAFTIEAHKLYSEVIRDCAFELVASIPAGMTELDAVKQFALKLPVIASMRPFGVPEEDLSFVLPRVETIMTFWSGSAPQPRTLPEILDALDQLHQYAAELMQGKRGKVLDDTVIARLAATSNDEVTSEQTIHQLVLLLIALYAPTTPGSLGSGCLAFCEHIDQIPNVPMCVENLANEVVRFNASNQFTWRLARRNLAIRGHRIKEGDAVAVFIGSANRDPSIFGHPNRFDLTRKNASRHLAFGNGPHACLGRQIAALEVKWFFHELFSRYEMIELNGEPLWNDNLEFRSLRSLPIRLIERSN